MYRYAMISKSEESPTERQRAELAAEAAAIKLEAQDRLSLKQSWLQHDDVLQIFFIKEDPNGYIKFPYPINGYCALSGKYIGIRHGLTPKSLIETTVHESRHAFQVRDPKLRMCSVEMRERDAELFVYEFWGSHGNSGDAAALMRTLEKIADEESDRLWKGACAEARARLSKPTNTESDQLRRQFEPIIRARARAIQQSVDPSGRGLLFFPSDIEFGVPCAGLKVSSK